MQILRPFPILINSVPFIRRDVLSPPNAFCFYKIYRILNPNVIFHYSYLIQIWKILFLEVKKYLYLNGHIVSLQPSHPCLLSVESVVTVGEGGGGGGVDCVGTRCLCCGTDAFRGGCDGRKEQADQTCIVRGQVLFFFLLFFLCFLVTPQRGSQQQMIKLFNPDTEK